MNRPRTAVAETLERLLCTASVLFLLVGVLTVGLNVALRYLLHLSLAWSAELARYSIVWSAFLAATVLVSRRQHLAVDLPGFRPGSRSRRLLDVVVAIGSMSFYLILAFSGMILVRNTTSQTSSSIEFLPMSAVYAIVPLSALLMWLATFASLLRTLRRDHDAPRHERDAT